jgi:threonine/homoserine/homoserine lactone efflux protein
LGWPARYLFGLLWGIQQLGAWSSIVRWLGAAYLIWLGIQAWRSSSEATVDPVPRVRDNIQAFGRGLLIELSNPKGIAFFLSVFAVSISAEASVATKLAAFLSGLAFELIWYLATILLFSSGPVRQLYRRWQVAVARVFGVLFVSLVSASPSHLTAKAHPKHAGWLPSCRRLRPTAAVVRLWRSPRAHQPPTSSSY